MVLRFPEVPSIRALGYFGTAELTRPQSRGRRRGRGRFRGMSLRSLTASPGWKRSWLNIRI